MIRKSITTFTTVMNNDIKLEYHLYFRNALYSVECYKEGFDKNKPSEYCYLEHITEDEGEAEWFFLTIVKGRVFPIHMQDMVQELLHS